MSKMKDSLLHLKRVEKGEYELDKMQKVLKFIKEAYEERAYTNFLEIEFQQEKKREKANSRFDKIHDRFLLFHVMQHGLDFKLAVDNIKNEATFLNDQFFRELNEDDLRRRFWKIVCYYLKKVGKDIQPLMYSTRTYEYDFENRCRVGHALLKDNDHAMPPPQTKKLSEIELTALMAETPKFDPSSSRMMSFKPDSLIKDSHSEFDDDSFISSTSSRPQPPEESDIVKGLKKIKLSRKYKNKAELLFN